MTRVQNVVYVTDQIDRGVAFFRDVLGLKLIARDGEASARFDAGDVTISLREPRMEGDPTGATVVLEVSDLELRIASLNCADGEVLSDRLTPGGRVATVRDPSGNVVELVQEPAAQPGADLPAAFEFLTRLEALRAGFEASAPAIPGAFSEPAVDLGHAMTEATLRRMATYAEGGATEHELILVFALAMAFTANLVMHCSAARGNSRVADSLFRTSRDAARQLGDGAEYHDLGARAPVQ
jgi:predicted enzyme related to lactoylglutathione lyase